MTATLVAFAVLVSTLSAVQQPAPATAYSVSGRIIDGSTGRPMIGAVAILWERSASRSDGKRATVGQNGVFEFSNIVPGSYLIAPAMPGLTVPYRTETIDIEVRGGSVTGLGLIITPLGPRLIPVSGKLVMENGAAIPDALAIIKANNTSTAIQRDGSFQLQFREDERYKLKLENLPEGITIKSVSAGSWSPASETLVFPSTPPASLQITLAVGTRVVRGRLLDSAGAAAGAEASLTLSLQGAASPLREVAPNRDGTFEIARLSPGNYELRARHGSGAATQFVTVPIAIGNQDRSGLEIALKPISRQRGLLVIEGAGRLEELQRFRPMMEITDVLGVHRVPIAADGTFEFQSIEGEYAAAIRDVPLGYAHTITIVGSTVEVRLRIIQGDGPGLRLLPPIRLLPPR
jgi:hypothetical protein